MVLLLPLLCALLVRVAQPTAAAQQPPAAAATPFTHSDFPISFWVDPIVPPPQFPAEYARLALANFTGRHGAALSATDPAAVAAQVAACAAAQLQCIPSSCESAAAPGGG